MYASCWSHPYDLSRRHTKHRRIEDQVISVEEYRFCGLRLLMNLLTSGLKGTRCRMKNESVHDFIQLDSTVLGYVV